MNTQFALATRIEMFDCEVDNLCMDEVIEKLKSFIQSDQPHQVAIVNANKFWRMENDPCLAEIVKKSSLILPEKAVVIGSWVLGKRLKEPVLGVSLFMKLIPVAAQYHYRVFFLGAKQAIVQRLVEKVSREYPGLQVVGWRNGYFKPEDEAEIVEKIRRAKPNILFVAMGTPRQECFISKNLNAMNVPVCIGLGGSFDVMAGLKKDAPQWVRAIAMEWFYRMLQDPRNLCKRYAITIPWFLFRVFKKKFSLGRRAIEI